jgi:hypothetical protein
MYRSFSHRIGTLVFRAAPNPLLGRWFGCPGAGPIRACHRNGGPATALMNECRRANQVGRERGPENGYPNRLPPQGLNDQWQSTQKRKIRKRLNLGTTSPSPPAPPA